MNRSFCGGDAGSTVEGVSIDAIAVGFGFVVDGVGWALSALALDVDEPTVAYTGIRVDVKNLVFAAIRSADGVLRVVVVGGNTVGADSQDEVEIFQASAYSVEILLVDAANNRDRNNNRRCDIGKSALALDEFISIRAGT